MNSTYRGKLDFSPKLLHIPIRPLVLPFSRTLSWVISHLIYFPVLCLACILSMLYGKPVALVLRPSMEDQEYICSDEIKRAGKGAPIRCGTGEKRPFVEISGYSFVGWGIIAVNDPMVIEHEFIHVENWLGSYNQNKLVFNVVPLMTAGIFITPLIGLGPLSLAFSLALVLTFSLMAFVKIFH